MNGFGKPPCWLRITWPICAEWPDEEDYPRHPSESIMRGRPKFPKRHHGVPDRWIYDLFIGGFSNEEIGQRCGLHPNYVVARLRQLEKMGYISNKQRRLRHSNHVRRANQGTNKYVPRYIKPSNRIRYWDVIRVFKKTRTIAETHRQTGISLGTVSRWVRRWEASCPTKQEVA